MRALVFVLALSGCYSTPRISPEDLRRVSADLLVAHEAIASIHTDRVTPSAARTLDRAREVVLGAARVTEQLAEIATDK